MIDIYIDGKKLQLYGNEEIVFTFQNADLSALWERSGDYSNTFKIPNTTNNRNIFGVPDDVHSLSIKPYQRLSLIVERSGTPIVIGYAILKRATRSYLEISVFSGNADWFAGLEDKKLRDLNLDKYNHVLTADHIRYTRSNHHHWKDGYVYPNAEYGRTYNTGGVWMDWRYYRPAVYAKLIFDEILKQNGGWQAVGDWWENDKFWFDEINVINDIAGNGGANSKWATVLPFSNSSFVRNKDYSLRAFATADTPDFSNALITVPTTPQTSSLKFLNVISFPNNGWRFIHPITQVPVILDRASVDLKITVEIDNPAFGGEFGLYITYKNSNDILQTEFIGGQYLNIGLQTFVFNFSLDCAPTELDIIFEWVDFSITAVNNITIELVDYNVLSEDSLDDYSINILFPFVTLNSTLPDISQAEFVKAVIQKFGLIPNADPVSKTINFKRFKNIVEDIPNAYDWSSKYDDSEEPEYSFTLDYAQENKWQDIDDENDKMIKGDEGYNSGIINVSNNTIETERVIYESPFAMLKRQQSYSGGIRLGHVPLWQPIDDTSPNNPNDDDLFEGNTIAPKLCLLRFEPYHLVQMKDGINTLPLETPTQPALHGLELTWEKILKRYYLPLESIINNAKIVRCLIRLNYADISTIDLTKPVWIERFRAYFYINKIEQFKVNRNESTLVELVKIGYDLEAGLVDEKTLKQVDIGKK